MNYKNHYNLLIESRLKLYDVRFDLKKLYNNSSNKIFENYFESHHIIPKCLGGTNDKSNLILLTPREHLLAHWLLSKVYSDNIKLFKGFYLMSTYKKYGKNYKLNSKLYAIRRHKFSIAISGKNNPFYGKTHKKCRKLENNPFYGKTHTSECLKNLSDMKKGNKNPMYKIKPWDNPKTKNNGLSYNWSQLDKIYNIWILNDKCGHIKLCKSSIKIDPILKYSMKSFANMIKLFKLEGSPIDNNEWRTFKLNYDTV